MPGTTYPHDAESKALAADEPLVDVNQDWMVEDAASDSVEDALGEDEVPHVRGERGEREGAGQDEKPCDAAHPSILGPALEKREDEWRAEVHDALARRR